MGGRGSWLGAMCMAGLASIAAAGPAVAASPAPGKRGKVGERVYRSSHHATQRKPQSDSLRRMLGKK